MDYSPCLRAAAVPCKEVCGFPGYCSAVVCFVFLMDSCCLQLDHFVEPIIRAEHYILFIPVIFNVSLISMVYSMIFASYDITSGFQETLPGSAAVSRLTAVTNCLSLFLSQRKKKDRLLLQTTDLKTESENLDNNVKSHVADHIFCCYRPIWLPFWKWLNKSQKSPRMPLSLILLQTLTSDVYTPLTHISKFLPLSPDMGES